MARLATSAISTSPTTTLKRTTLRRAASESASTKPSALAWVNGLERKSIKLHAKPYAASVSVARGTRAMPALSA